MPDTSMLTLLVLLSLAIVGPMLTIQLPICAFLPPSWKSCLVIAVSSAGVKLGLISASINEALVIVAICTVLLSPLLFNGWQKPVQ